MRRGASGPAWSAHLGAELLRCAGSTDPQPWCDAEAAWGRIEHPHQQGWALLRQAECLVVGGRRDEATAPLTRALQIGQRLGARPLVDAVAAPRLSSRNGAEEFDLGLADSEVGRQLSGLGHQLVPPPRRWIGNASAIRFLDGDRFEAAAETERGYGGSAMVVHPHPHPHP